MRLRCGRRGRWLSRFETWRWRIGHDERLCGIGLDAMVITYLSRQGDAAVTRRQSTDLVPTVCPNTVDFGVVGTE